MRISFRMRGHERDSATDAARFERLQLLVEKIRTEIKSELEGLQNRFESASVSAAFAQQAFEGDQSRMDLSSTVDELTELMAQYRSRIDTLHRQYEWLSEIEKQIFAYRYSD
jgi:hypothetical protein